MLCTPPRFLESVLLFCDVVLALEVIFRRTRIQVEVEFLVKTFEKVNRRFPFI